jgi:hypothetical protein
LRDSFWFTFTMAPFDQLLFEASAIRPEHVTLSEPHPTLRSIVNTIEDPYYSHHRPREASQYLPSTL